VRDQTKDSVNYSGPTVDARGISAYQTTVWSALVRLKLTYPTADRVQLTHHPDVFMFNALASPAMGHWGLPASYFGDHSLYGISAIA